MRASLQRRLTVLLGGTLLLAAIVAAVASFLLAYGEAREFQDDMLKQIGLRAAREPGAPPQPPARDIALADPESRVSVFRVPGDRPPDWFDVALPAGFHTLRADGDDVRVFVQRNSGNDITVVAQPTDTRDELALNSALRTLAPLLLLFPVMAWLIVRIVHRELAPVSELAKHLDSQPADGPRPLPDARVPDEILPFVQAINRLLVRVGSLLEQQKRFIADAAHELRSPLTALSVQAENLHQAPTPAALLERVAPLQAGIERARRLTEQLLSLARVQAAAAAIAPVDVPTLARELIAEFVPLAAAKGVDLGLDEAVPFKLEASPDNLRLVLRNVLENAVKYTPVGGQVTLRLRTDSTAAVIEIIDSGPGIPVAERERVFDAFYRLPGADGTGSGLGLAIAREAAARSGGELSLANAGEHGGLTVRYRLKLTS